MNLRGELLKKDINRVGHWTKKELGNEFRKSINNFAIDNVNIVPYYIT